MRALDGVGHGSLLAGRYRLEERVRAEADGSLWRAVDETLDRQVTVRVVRPGHRHTADVIDAARRAGLVEDPRLAKILDVAAPGSTAYIVTEHLVGRTLDELLLDGPLPAETVRRLVGDAAIGLDRASSRGLHHLKLTPASLLITSDGAVKVIGTAVEAALAGAEQDEDPVGADRADAVGLVSLLYAGLTGRWPGVVDGPLGPAPRITGRAVPPGELVAGVPADLDLICRSTLGPDHDGPRSPGELAERLSPWARAEPLTGPRGLTVSPSRPQAAAATPEPARQEPVRLPNRESVSLGARSAPVSGAAASSSSPDSSSRSDSSSPAAGWPGWDELTPPARSGPGGVSSGPGPTPSAAPAPEVMASSTSSPGSAPAGGAISPGGPAGPGGPVPRMTDTGSWSLFEPVPDEESLGPFLPPAPLTRPPNDQIRLVLVIVSGLVVLGLILAVFTLRGLGSPTPLVNDRSSTPPGPTNTPVASSPSTPAPNSAGAAPGSPTVSPSASPSVSSTPSEITGIQALDPQGDGNENGSSAPSAIDDDGSTTWRSDRYQSSSFGGLKKGLGLYLTLGEGSVHSVVINVPGSTGGTVELRTAPGPGLDSSVVVGTAQGQDGKIVVTPTQPLNVTQLLLWFTELPRQGNGEYRLVVSEITVT